MREIIKQAATVDEAISLALKELNLEREDVTAEVLEYPGKKLFFKTPAKVKVSELEPDFMVKDIFREKSPEETKQPLREEKRTIIEKQGHSEAPRTQSPRALHTPLEQEIFVEVPISEASDKAKYAMEFLKSVVGQFFDGEYKMQPVKTQTGYIIKIVGGDAGCLIGRKGETMEALSYLTSLAANRNDDSVEKISVDVADYRQKREKDLQVIARKMAIKVAKFGRPYIFEPMNPYERRIIHATVGEIEGVKSESKGEGSQRRVAIYSTVPRKPRPQGDKPAYEPRPQGDKPAYAPRAYNNDRSGSKPTYNRNSRDRATQPVQKTRDEKMVDSAGAALYSKIDLD